VISSPLFHSSPKILLPIVEDLLDDKVEQSAEFVSCDLLKMLVLSEKLLIYKDNLYVGGAISVTTRSY